LKYWDDQNDEMGGACSMHEAIRNAYILVGKSEGTELKEIGYEGVDWIHLSQNRNQVVVNMVMGLLVP
jgi:hypothetical protein